MIAVNYNNIAGFAFRQCLQLSDGGIAWSIVDTTQCTTLVFVQLSARVSFYTYMYGRMSVEEKIPKL